MRLSTIVLPGLLGLSLTAATTGGWAVITVEDLPTHLVAGQPAELRFKVRQHGVEVMHDLQPVVIATKGKQRARINARHQGSGIYAAEINVPDAGQWSLTVDGQWHAAKVTLLPLTAIASGQRATVLPEHYRGKQLFVAKGCITCHVHGDVQDSGPVPIGPDLTKPAYAADYLKMWLADPTMRPPKDPNKRMPKLELKPQEITALVAFLNKSTGVAIR